MSEKELIETINVPKEVIVETPEENCLILKGKKGEVKRVFKSHRLKISHKENKITLEGFPSNKQTKALLNSVVAHVRNMVDGTLYGYKTKMKICYSHFPATANLEGNLIKLKNFTGEKNIRTAKIVGNTKVEIKGEEITLTGINKEEIGQTAANIELCAKVKGKDIRRFQDGIFIVEKGFEEEKTEDSIKVEEKEVEVQ